MKLPLSLLLVSLSAFAQSPHLTSEVEGISQLRKDFGITSEYLSNPNLKNRKVAILANIARPAYLSTPLKYLPSNYAFLGTDKEAFLNFNAQAGRLAQVIWAMVGDETNYPKFYFSDPDADANKQLQNFNRDVDSAIAEKVDVVLNLRNFEGFGNFNGNGPVNRIVDKLVESGILVVQSKGEYGNLVYNGPIRPPVGKTQDQDNLVAFRYPGGTEDKFSELNGAELYVNLRTTVRIILSYNSYSDGEDIGPGTNKNLNLGVYDHKNETLPKESKIVQVDTSLTKKPVGDGESKLPYESLEITLDPNPKPYMIRVTMAGGTFNPKRDAFRLTVIPDRGPHSTIDASGKTVVTHPVRLVQFSEGADIMIPAENPQVLTIAARTEPYKMTTLPSGKLKPDIRLLTNQVKFTNNAEVGGSDLAAAQMTALYLLVLTAFPDNIQPHKFIEWSKRTITPEGRLTIPKYQSQKAKYAQ